MWTAHTHIGSTQCKELKDFIQLEAQQLNLEIWTRKMSCFCRSCSIAEQDECELLEWVDTWHRVTLGTDMSLVNEITPLEENENEISMDYDQISDLIQLGIN